MKKEEYKYIYSVIKPYITKEIIGLIIIIAATFLSLLNPYILKQIIDVSIANKDINSLIRNVLFFIGIFLVSRLLSIIQSYLFTYIGEKLLYDLRMRLYRSISYKEITFFNKKQTGELMSRILNELPDVTNLFAGVLINIITQLVTLVLTFIIMFSLNRVITLISLLVTPFIYLVLKYYNPRFKETNTLLMQDNSRISDRLQENLNNIKAIKYMNAHKYTEKRFSKSLHRFINRKFDFLKLNVSSNFLLSVLYFLPSLILLLYGGHLVISGYLTIGSIVALNSYISRLFSPIRTLSQINLDLQKSMAAFRRYYELIDDINDKSDDSKISIDKLKTGIIVENVSFAYPGKSEIFNNLDLTIPVGETVLVKGANGAGKSTLIDLLCGILKPEDDSVKYDGIDIKNINKYSLKKLIGIVPQNIYLFNDTIRNNIKLGRYIKDERIIALSKELEFTDITNSEEINLDTVITTNGGNLSGGQKQKIAILRALIHNPQILILDEAASFLDENSRDRFYDYISKNNKNRIIMIISHEKLAEVNVKIVLTMNEFIKQEAIAVN